MAIYITDPEIEERLKAERAASGADRFDEVWEGVLFMPPLANNQHQGMATRWAIITHHAVGPDAEIYVGVNVSDRDKGWTYNYRIPDVAIFLKGNPARDCGTHWFGGPDWLLEITSPADRGFEKVPFYARIGVREALFIERNPWKLSLYQREQDDLVLAGESTLEQPTLLESKVLPLRFRLILGSDRPMIEVMHTDGVQRWLV